VKAFKGNLQTALSLTLNKLQLLFLTKRCNITIQWIWLPSQPVVSCTPPTYGTVHYPASQGVLKQKISQHLLILTLTQQTAT